ncbi:MAG TPA: HAD family phosphatase [Gemmatimonadales bacterium]|nr:HAD family phosphatase [Gemmatimonadales bacterium]
MPESTTRGGTQTEVVLFDFNGVIVDDEEQHREALTSVLGDSGIPLAREQYYGEYLGWNDEMCFVTAFRSAKQDLSGARLAELVREKSRRYEALIRRSLLLVPGAGEFVDRAAGAFRLGIVSGALRREIEIVLERTGLKRHFEVIVSAEDVEACKPDPAGYLRAHAALGRRQAVAPAACIAIEDSLPGMAAARAAGMRCVMLTTSHSQETLNGEGAEFVWTSFTGHDPGELLTLGRQ